MADAFNLNIGGLKCDTPECGYMNKNVSMKDYDKWVDAPCPLCGASLLTKADYKLVKKLERRVNIANGIVRFFVGDKFPKNKGNDSVHFEMNGTGTLDIKSIDIQNKHIDIRR